MDDIVQLISSSGNLHDAVMLGLEWHGAESTLYLRIDDLQSNFSGLAEYQGPQPVRFRCSGVTLLRLSVDVTAVGLMIYRWKVEKLQSGSYKSQISFSPGGEMLMECVEINCVAEKNGPSASALR